MAIEALDHVNVRTPDPERTLNFFRDILDMRIGPPPGGTSTEMGGWVYDRRDLPIVHVGRLDAKYPTDGEAGAEIAHGSGVVHHVALTCSDFDGTKDRLASLAVDFRETNFPQFGFRQLFVTEPNGVLLELNFRTAKQAGET